MAGDKPNPTQRPAPARGPGGGALQQRKRPARTCLSASFDVAATSRRWRPRPSREGVRLAPHTPSTRRIKKRRASGGRRPQQQPGILRFYAEETPGLKIGPTTVRGRVAFYCNLFTVASMASRWGRSLLEHAIDTAPHTLTQRNAQVLVMSVMFVGFVVLLHIYGKLTAVPDAVDEDPIMPETPGADA